MGEDTFEPRLGRLRATRSGRAPRYLGQVLKAVALAGGLRGRPRAKFQGNRIGRGAGVGRVLRARDHLAAYRARRVVIKTRIVKLAGRGLESATRHLNYLQRDGVTRDGESGTLYDARSDQADGRAFLDPCGDDRHQFRIIVAPEDGEHYEDLHGVTRRLMRQMEEDLGTRLDWVAVDHFNTGHPHTHIVLRGQDDQGKDLVIARDYLSYGMRERAAEIVLFDLGPKSDSEIAQQLRREVEQERFTSLDRDLLRGRNANGLVLATSPAGAAVAQSECAGRLQKLKRLGLAEELRPGIWRLDTDLEPTLRRMGERGDIIKTLHRTRADAARAPKDYAIFDSGGPPQTAVVGQVVARGLSDELKDHHYLVVDGTDGRSWYVDIGAPVAADEIATGAIVRLTATPRTARAADHTVAEIAAAHEGRYSIQGHHDHDPRASHAFVETHVRRLEALRRANAGVTREADGSWRIAPDHVARAEAYERARAARTPVHTEILSTLDLTKQQHFDGPTWLDRELAQRTVAPRDQGFGRDVRQALVQRRRWLIEQELGDRDGDRFVIRPQALAELRGRELRRVGAQLSGELGLAYVEAPTKGTVTGALRQTVQTSSGRFAVIAKSREFSLVPWRPALETQIGKTVTGLIRGNGITWSIGRQRGGPSV